MSYIVDRRLNAKNKSAVNRQRFLRRYRKHIQKAVSDAVTQRSITDIDKGEQISIPTRDINEPIFHHDLSGFLFNLQRDEQAMAELATAATLAERNAFIADRAALLHSRLGDMQGAEKWASIAAERKRNAATYSDDALPTDNTPEP